MKQRVIIIGAGIGGLATANLLAKAGYDVTVCEQHAGPGGRADRFDAEGFRFDMGPSWYLMTDVFEHYYQLLDEKVADHLKLQRLSPAYKVFFEQHDSLVVTSQLTKDAASFEAMEPGAGRALRRYVARSRAIYDLAVQEFLYSNFDSWRDFLRPSLLRAGPRMARLAVTPIHRYVAGFFKRLQLQQIMEYPMVFLGTSPFKAPAIYSLMSALDFDEGVFYPRGGLFEVIASLEAIGRKLGVSYRYNAPVAEIVVTAGRASGVRLEDGRQLKADIVVSNADLHFTETQLLPESARSYPESYWQKQQAGPSALLLYLGVRGKLPELVHHNLYFVEQWRENFKAIYQTKQTTSPASLYVCKPSQTDPTVAPKGHENLFVLVPLPPGISLTAKQQAALADEYIDQIAVQSGVPDLRQRIVYQRSFGPNDFRSKFHAWQASALGPSHVLKQSALWRTPNKSKNVSNLYYVGAATTPGIGLPMCLISAELVYKRLTGDRRGGRVRAIKSLGGGD